jgi:hypothetical protein
MTHSISATTPTSRLSCPKCLAQQSKIVECFPGSINQDAKEKWTVCNNSLTSVRSIVLEVTDVTVQALTTELKRVKTLPPTERPSIEVLADLATIAQNSADFVTNQAYAAYLVAAIKNKKINFVTSRTVVVSMQLADIHISEEEVPAVVVEGAIVQPKTTKKVFNVPESFTRMLQPLADCSCGSTRVESWFRDEELYTVNVPKEELPSSPIEGGMSKTLFGSFQSIIVGSVSAICLPLRKGKKAAERGEALVGGVISYLYFQLLCMLLLPKGEEFPHTKQTATRMREFLRKQNFDMVNVAKGRFDRAKQKGSEVLLPDLKYYNPALAEEIAELISKDILSSAFIRDWEDLYKVSPSGAWSRSNALSEKAQAQFPGKKCTDRHHIVEADGTITIPSEKVFYPLWVEQLFESCADISELSRNLENPTFSSAQNTINSEFKRRELIKYFGSPKLKASVVSEVESTSVLSFEALKNAATKAQRSFLKLFRVVTHKGEKKEKREKVLNALSFEQEKKVFLNCPRNDLVCTRIGKIVAEQTENYINYQFADFFKDCNADNLSFKICEFNKIPSTMGIDNIHGSYFTTFPSLRDEVKKYLLDGSEPLGVKANKMRDPNVDLTGFTRVSGKKNRRDIKNPPKGGDKKDTRAPKRELPPTSLKKDEEFNKKAPNCKFENCRALKAGKCTYSHEDRPVFWRKNPNPKPASEDSKPADERKGKAGKPKAEVKPEPAEDDRLTKIEKSLAQLAKSVALQAAGLNPNQLAMLNPFFA